MEPDFESQSDVETVAEEPEDFEYPDTFVEYEAEYTEVEESETEFEPQGFEHERADEAAEEERAFGDMSLEGLLGRLEGALDAHKKMVAESEKAAEEPAPQPIPMTREPAVEDEDEGQDANLTEAAEDDPVIAFLRREASRRMPQPMDPDEDVADVDESHATGTPTDAQEALRSALERLGQVNRRD